MTRTLSTRTAGGSLSLVLSLLLVCDVARPADIQADQNQPILIEAADGAALQAVMDAHAQSGGLLRLREPVELTCLALEAQLGDEVSRHALLIPEGVELDLNGSTLLLDLRDNAYGVRLSNRSAIRNGTIRIVRSENKGSQAIWHAGISIGAAYDEGGTPEQPGRFSKVSHWIVEDLTIDQPFEAAAIQLMSEACHGEIRRVKILDSDKALLGIGMDWGSVGKITAADETIPHVRTLWEQGELYSTHPHNILIEDIHVGRLTRNVDCNDAGVRCSACYNITIRDVHVEAAACAVAIFGGDCGFEFAPEELRPLAHTNYRVENIVIDTAFRCGFAFNGQADNVYRSTKSHGYQTMLDPSVPGLNGLIISNCRINGDRSPHSVGMFITAVSNVEVTDVVLRNFLIGARIKDWINGLHFENTDLSDNDQPRSISAASAEPTDLRFD